MRFFSHNLGFVNKNKLSKVNNTLLLTLTKNIMIIHKKTNQVSKVNLREELKLSEILQLRKKEVIMKLCQAVFFHKSR